MLLSIVYYILLDIEMSTKKQKAIYLISLFAPIFMNYSNLILICQVLLIILPIIIIIMNCYNVIFAI